MRMRKFTLWRLVCNVLKEDWSYRLPNHAYYNRYRGLSRPAYALLCCIYYSFKSLIFLELAICWYLYKFILWDIWNWIFKLDERKWAIRFKDWWVSLALDNGWINYDDLEEFEVEEDIQNGYEYDDDFCEVCNKTIVVDDMSGSDFEQFCAELLRLNGFLNVIITPGSGDQGIDIIAEKDDMKWGFQCKRWGVETHIGNDIILKTAGAKNFYRCDIVVVIATTTFTRQAEQAAEQTGVLLWGREKLHRLMEKMEDSTYSSK